MSSLARYARFVKVEHTLFSLPMLFAGALLGARSFPSSRTVVLIVLAGFGARIVALCLNRIFDARIDRLNPRTADRELASGKMKFWEAWLLALASGALYFFAAWLLNDLCFKLSWIPITAFAAYPLMKRFTHWSHFFLGVVWSLTPIAGFLAVQPSFDGAGPAWLLAIFSLCWLTGFDIIYALQDEEFDRAQGLHSLPAEIGGERALVVSALFHAAAFASLIALYLFYLTGPFAVLLLVLSGVLLYMEHRFARNVNLAFFKINIATGFVVLSLVAFGL